MTEASEASDDSNLSEFTLSIRSAVRFCNQKYQNLSTEGEKDKPKLPIEISSKVCHCVNEIKTRRQRAYDKFWGAVDDTFEMKAIHVDKTTSPQDFRKNFHNPNLPCLIDFQEDENSPFRYVNKHWRTANTTTTTQKVNRNWFLKTFGPNTLVPLRYYPQNESFDLGIVLFIINDILFYAQSLIDNYPGTAPAV